MVYSQSLAERCRIALRDQPGIAEKKMFGGVVFQLAGNILVGVWQTSLIVRLGPEPAAAALQQPHVREFDVTGRPMRGWVMVDPEGLDSVRQLAGWIEQAVRFVETLPPK